MGTVVKRDIRDQPFIWMAKDVWANYSQKMEAFGIAVYMALAYYSNSADEHAWPSTETIAMATGLGHRTVVETLDHLVQLGLLRPIARPGRTTVYQLIDPCTTRTPAPGAPPPLHTVHDTPARGAGEQQEQNNTNVNDKNKRERGADSAPARSRPDPPTSPPAQKSIPKGKPRFEIPDCLRPWYQAYCEGMGLAVDNLAPSVAAMLFDFLSELNAGKSMSPADLRALIAYRISDPRWQPFHVATDLKNIVGIYGWWAGNGRPARWRDSARPNSRGHVGRQSYWSPEELRAAREADRGQEWMLPPE